MVKAITYISTRLKKPTKKHHLNSFFSTISHPFSSPSFSVAMSSILTSQGAVFATAAVAVSGTVLLLAFRLQKSLPTTQFSINSIPQSPPSGPPRSCISSDGKRREKKKKRVHFAEDVVDPIGNSDEYRKLQSSNSSHRNTSVSNSSTTTFKNSEKVQRRMPANRLALYNGILRDRVLHRVAYSY